MLPNIAVINALNERNDSPEFFYIGENNSIEQRLIKKLNVRFFCINAGKLRRYFSLQNFLDIFKVVVGFFQAIFLLLKLRPDLVFAKGGYVSVPVVVAAWILRIPIFIHESDVSPGLSTRICSRFAREIFVSFRETKISPSIPQAKIHVVGNPIRSELLEGDKRKGYEFTGFSPKLPVVLFSGGSTGALSLNELLYKALPELLLHVQVVHITGPHTSHIKNSHYRAFEFLEDEFADIYAISDLSVGRAGSGSIFELLALQIPMILIPLGRDASRGDQIENAMVFERNGWAVMLDQKELTSEKLCGEILKLLNDKKALHAMREHQSKSNLNNAAAILADRIGSLKIFHRKS